MDMDIWQLIKDIILSKGREQRVEGYLRWSTVQYIWRKFTCCRAGGGGVDRR